MSTVGVTRKLYIDSRFKVSGTDSDFLIELPVDVDCTRTSSFFVASCSFANTYQTITDKNNTLYVIRVIAGANGSVIRKQIPAGSYTPDQLATALSQALSPLFGDTTFTFDTATGIYTVQYNSAVGTMIIPNYTEVNTYAQAFLQDPVPGIKDESINAILNMPNQFPNIPVGVSTFLTGIVDLVPLREIYLHCSLANNRTLHSNGARDCIARIPIDVPFGDVVTFRHLGPSDALSCSDVHFRTIRFQLRDWAGNLVPVESFVVIELCFLDIDPYAL